MSATRPSRPPPGSLGVWVAGAVVLACTSTIGPAGLNVPVPACDLQCYDEGDPVTTMREDVHEAIMEGGGACDGCGWCEHAQGNERACLDFEDSREFSRFVRGGLDSPRDISRRCYLCTGVACSILAPSNEHLLPCDGRALSNPSGSYEAMCTYDADEYEKACPAHASGR